MRRGRPTRSPPRSMTTSLTFGEPRPAGEPNRQRARRDRDRARRRACCGGATPRSRQFPCSALAKLGAVFAAAERRGASVEERRRSPEYCARPRSLSMPHRQAGAELTARGIRVLLADVPCGRRRRPARRRTRRARSCTSSSSRAGAPGDRRASCCPIEPTGSRTYVGATSTPGGAGTVCMFPLFHMAGWTLAMERGKDGGPMHFVRVPDAETLLRDDRPPSRCAALLHPRGLVSHPRARSRGRSICRASTRPTPVRRRRHRSCCARSRTRSRHTGPACSTDRPKPGQACNSATRTCSASRAASACAQPGVDVRLADGGEVVHAEPVPDGRVLRRHRRDGRALARRLVPHRRSRRFDDEGYLSIVGRARDVIRTGGETVAPPEVEAVLSTHPGDRRDRGRRRARRASGARSSPRSSSSGPATHAPDVDALAVVLRRPARAAFKQPRRLAVVDALPEPPRPARSSAP